MSILLSAYQIEKTFGDKRLFRGLSFGVHENQKLALLGPNGSGKSTLLKILAGWDSPDQGEVSLRKNLKTAYVAQQDVFELGATAIEEAQSSLQKFGVPKDEASVQASIYLSMAGFENLQIEISKLSGGWKKRLSLAIAFAKDADLLLLDEPTNHLDWEGILWLEGQLSAFAKTMILISHDRDFLKSQCREYMELGKMYEEGYLRYEGTYESFIEKKHLYIEAQAKLKDSMSNKARREVEWLRAGVKARTTKSQSRIKEAHQLLEDLGELKARTSSASQEVNMVIEQAGKTAKRFVEADNLGIQWGDKKILENLKVDFLRGQKWGILGDNASGKTSLLKVISGKAQNYTGFLKRAEDLKIVYFDQKRESLDQSQTVLEFIGDGSDHVTFNGRSTHVASYAAGFLFGADKMNFPIARLSGGEQARLLIAKLLLQPADVLVLDEPTNDLDIETIETLEKSLQSFKGLLLLVSHDRYFLNQSCEKFLALDGKGGWQVYADIYQWLNKRGDEVESIPVEDEPISVAQVKKVKSLSYKEKKLLETIEQDIQVAEQEVEKAQVALDSNDKFDDHAHIQKLVSELEACQAKVEELYESWQALEEKQKLIEQNR